MTTYYKRVNGVRVAMTPEEIADITPTPAEIIANKRKELLSKFEADLQENALDIASAVAEDGVNEQTNIDALRSTRAQIKSQFQQNIIALITGAN